MPETVYRRDPLQGPRQLQRVRGYHVRKLGLAIVITTVYCATIIATLTGTANAASAPRDAEATLLSLVNHERTSLGLDPLRWDADLATVARTHSARMAGEQQLSHNQSIASDVRAWRMLGENVGVGDDAAAVHDAFMASSAHRATMRDAYTQIGVGIEIRDGRLWVTEVFRTPKTQRPRARSRSAAHANPVRHSSRPEVHHARPSADAAAKPSKRAPRPLAPTPADAQRTASMLTHLAAEFAAQLLLFGSP